MTSVIILFSVLDVFLSPSGLNVSEGNTYEQICVELSRDVFLGCDVTITFSLTGITACEHKLKVAFCMSHAVYSPSTASEDFDGDEITVMIPAGPTPHFECFNSTFVTDDDVVEGMERLQVELVETSLAEYVSLRFVASPIDVTIIDDDDGKNSCSYIFFSFCDSCSCQGWL